MIYSLSYGLFEILTCWISRFPMLVKLENVENTLIREIMVQIEKYAEGNRSMIKEYVSQKYLVNKDDCLLGWFENELQRIQKHILQIEYSSTAIGRLWRVLEEELQLQLQKHKDKKHYKKKPSKLNYIKEALPIFVKLKTTHV